MSKAVDVVHSKEMEMANRNVELIFEFERYLLDHPQLAEQIPDGAVMCFQLKEDEAFNKWSRKLAEERASKEGKPLVHIAIQRLRPIRSRIEKLEVVQTFSEPNG